MHDKVSHRLKRTAKTVKIYPKIKVIFMGEQALVQLFPQVLINGV